MEKRFSDFIEFSEEHFQTKKKDEKRKDAIIRDLSLPFIERIERRLYRSWFYKKRKLKIIRSSLKEYGRSSVPLKHPIFSRSMFRGKYKGDEAEVDITFSKYPDFTISIRTTNTDPDPFRQVFLEKQYSPILDEIKNPRYILDLGANVGYSTLWFAMKYPNSNIFSIEPFSTNFERLQYQIKKCNLDKRVNAFNVAIYDVNTEKEIFIESHEYFHTGATLDAEIWKTEGFVPKHKVRCLTLPAIANLTGKDSFDIIKMDIQGVERKIFSNPDSRFIDIINNSKIVITENHQFYDHFVVDSFFKDLGWKISRFHENTFYRR